MEIKNKWKMILAIFAAALFIFEIFALGLLGNTSMNGGQSTDVIPGTTEFRGAIRTYDPILVIPLDTDEEVLTELRQMEGVKDVIVSQDSISISTDTRDEVYPVAEFLRGENVTSYAVANIAMPSKMEVTLGNGSVINATGGGAPIRMVTEPIIDVDTEITIKMIVGLSGSMVVTYSSPMIVSEEKEITVDSTVLEVDYIYTYLIPWEDRNTIDVSSMEYPAEYNRKNSVLLGEALTLEEVMQKKNLSYVEYIDQYSIECSENFTDVEQIMADFSSNITLPNSELVVTSNETVNLNYTGTVVYSYVLSVPEKADGITLDVDEVELELDELYDENSTIKLDIMGTVIGEKMVAVKSIEHT